MVSVIVCGFILVTKAAKEYDLFISRMGLSHQRAFSSGFASYLFNYLSNYDHQLIFFYFFIQFGPCFLHCCVCLHLPPDGLISYSSPEGQLMMPPGYPIACLNDSTYDGAHERRRVKRTLVITFLLHAGLV